MPVQMIESEEVMMIEASDDALEAAVGENQLSCPTAMWEYNC
jgi:hypothetical protein